MMEPLTRRRFIISLGSMTAMSLLPSGALNAASSRLPLSNSLPGSELKFGYAAITWGGNDSEAIREISDVGFRGIQLRSNTLKDYGDKPKVLAGLLKQHHLQFVALSGGGPGNSDYTADDEIAKQVKNATFVRDAGGMYLQMTDSARPKNRRPGAEDYKRLGGLLSEVGKRTSQLGVSMAYHNHMHSLGEGPDEVDAIMESSDPRYARLLLDIAHYAQGGGDPVNAIRKYHDRILFLHIKDVETVDSAATPQQSYRFVELGKGRVNLPAVFQAIKETNFRGWAIVELDSVPDKTRTPKECALISKKYLEEKLGMKI
jgi:inosose dehydratase